MSADISPIVCLELLALAVSRELLRGNLCLSRRGVYRFTRIFIQYLPIHFPISHIALLVSNLEIALERIEYATLLERLPNVGILAISLLRVHKYDGVILMGLIHYHLVRIGHIYEVAVGGAYLMPTCSHCSMRD